VALGHDIVNNVAPNVENHYVPHAVDSGVYKPLADEEIETLKKNQFGDDQRVTFFWNNRNARRKQSGSLIHWFSEFADEVGPKNVRLIMHTDPKDPNGQDLEKIIADLNIADDGRVLISNNKVSPTVLAAMYNIADCTLNISDAEGFGLATLESLSCQTPIIVNMTGGLQEQVTDGEEWFGIGIEPASKAIIGSQSVPYIYEDRISKEDFKAALHKIYNMTPSQRKLLGMKGRNHVVKNYNFDNFRKQWINLMDSVVENHGSWETRNGYKPWEMLEIK
jgi:glycosyltransferase involved in cell wall biosynthesis